MKFLGIHPWDTCNNENVPRPCNYHKYERSQYNDEGIMLAVLKDAEDESLEGLEAASDMFDALMEVVKDN